MTSVRQLSNNLLVPQQRQFLILHFLNIYFIGTYEGIYLIDYLFEICSVTNATKRYSIKFTFQFSPQCSFLNQNSTRTCFHQALIFACFFEGRRKLSYQVTDTLDFQLERDLRCRAHEFENL